MDLEYQTTAPSLEAQLQSATIYNTDHPEDMKVKQFTRKALEQSLIVQQIVDETDQAVAPAVSDLQTSLSTSEVHFTPRQPEKLR